MNDPFGLRRFEDAQRQVYAQAVKELSHGRTAIENSPGSAEAKRITGHLASKWQAHRRWPFSRREPVRDRQRGALVGFQGDLLREHDVTRHQRNVGDETITDPSPALIVELIDIYR